VIARSARWRERDKPREAADDLPGHFVEAPTSAGLPPAWLHLMLAAWQLYGTRYPPFGFLVPDVDYRRM
jgi:hypothetical protein